MADTAATGANAISSELHAILRITGVGIWSYDSAAGCFEVDATCREIFDVGPNEPIDRDLMQRCIHPDDLAFYYRAVQEAMAGSGEFAIEYRVVHRDGSVRYISGRGRASAREPGAPPVMHGVCIDMSERYALEQQLHATELQMRTLADGFPGLFGYVDRDYVVRYLSDRYVEHIGVPREQLVGRHLAELTGAEHFRERKPLYEQALAGIPHSFEDGRRMPGGRDRYYAITYQPDRGPDGAVRGFMTIGLDITELRRTEQALQQLTAELARSNHDLEQFAYVASHDLKAPLRAMATLVGWLQEDLAGHDVGDVQKNLALLTQRATRLNHLLDDLLAYSRAGRGNDAAAVVDTRELVQDIVTLLAPPPGMRVEAAAGLPTLRTARSPLEQVLRNLIGNAIKHHPGGSGCVRVGAERRGELVLFSVEDDGAGIPPEFSDKVFQMFQTLEPRDGVEGSGMGLAIVRRLVELHGGRVWFQPAAAGQGTVFRFTWRAPAGNAREQPGRSGFSRDPVPSASNREM